MISAAGVVNRILGYITFTVTGAQTERFLTLVMKTNTDIWSVRRLDAVTVRACARRCDLERVERLCREAFCDFKLLYEKGVPRTVFKYRRRYGLAIGVALFALLTVLMSSFVWSVEISGAENIWQEERILSSLAENGLYVGAFSRGQDWQRLKLRVLEANDDIAYLTVNLKGSKVFVEVAQERLSPDILEEHIPTDVVAAKDGVILSVFAENGKVTVKKGQAVKEGQMLINGIYDSRVLGFRPVHAYGRVYALTLHRISVFCPYEEQIRIPTGRTHTHITVTLFGKSFSLSKDCEFENCTRVTETKELTLGNGFILPISVTAVTCSEYENGTRISDEAAAETRARIILGERERIELRDTVLESRREILTVTSTGVELEYVYTLTEDIAKLRRINIKEEDTDGSDHQY